jgi:hypothetical protein
MSSNREVGWPELDRSPFCGSLPSRNAYKGVDSNMYTGSVGCSSKECPVKPRTETFATSLGELITTLSKRWNKRVIHA